MDLKIRFLARLNSPKVLGKITCSTQVSVDRHNTRYSKPPEKLWKMEGVGDRNLGSWNVNDHGWVTRAQTASSSEKRNGGNRDDLEQALKQAYNLQLKDPINN